MLVYVAMGLLPLILAIILFVLHVVGPWTSVAIVVILTVLVDRTVGHASRGHALRAVDGYKGAATPVPDPSAAMPFAKRWYIESTVGSSVVHSCSFIEFDERGDYLDFWQHKHAYETVMRLALARGEPPLFVMFVHGWRHSGQSNNVLQFNEFLHQLADANPGRRVHGIYLAWRGGALKHIIDETAFQSAIRYFGQPIVDVRQRARLAWLTFLLETCSYFDRKRIPEHFFSGTGISRTIFTCADAAKRNNPACEVHLLGHSFGALMLERTFQNAAISQLVAEWPLGQPADLGQARVNPLSFDSVILVNSAAPSIYARQFQSFLAAHRQAMSRLGVPNASCPLVFSLTSSADWATGVTHPLANCLSRFLPTLKHVYLGSDYVLQQKSGGDNERIGQWYYYRHTPGHNPLLVNRFIEAVSSFHPSVGHSSNVAQNRASRNASFLTSNGNQTATWTVTFPPTSRDFRDFSWYRRLGQFRPLVWSQDGAGRYPFSETAYWIVRCPKAIIASHDDIWSQAAMDTYAALHALARL